MVVCHSSIKMMTNEFWIWRSNLPGIMTIISDIDDFDFDQRNMDEIKHGLIGTSDEKGFWFDYQLTKIKIKISLDQEDNDIVHIKLFGDLDDKVTKLISTIGTDFELRTKSRRIE